MRQLFAALIAVMTFAFAAPAQAQGRWLRAESPGFIVYSTSSERNVRSLVQDLEAFDALLRRLTNATAERSPTKLEIYLFNGPGQFQEAFPGVGSSVRGLYTAGPDLIAAFAIFRDRYGMDAQDILFHEYAHHFMYQHFSNPYPSWYIEGFAEFVATTEFESERIVLGRSSVARASWLFGGSWLPMERMISSAPRDLDGEETARFYAQSWLFTHYLFSTPGGMDRFREYVRSLRLGADPQQAFEDGFGVTPQQMQATLREYLQDSPDALALTRPAAVDEATVAVTRLPPSANELLPLASRMRRGYLSEEAGAELLSRIRSIAGFEPNDPFALLALAQAEATIGDIGRARVLAERRLEANANDTVAHYVMGYTFLRVARDSEGDEALDLYAQARRHFTRAYRADENNFAALYRYAETFSGLDLSDEEASNVTNVLLLAHQLAPQVDEITFYAADVLVSRERYAEAIPLLRMLAFDPHGGDGADRARQRLNAAEEQLSASAAQ
ncbi:MAG: hypothetical protein AB7O98_09900 [Hyphomonadaceae bacterium]